jgi:hypothetical protein
VAMLEFSISTKKKTYILRRAIQGVFKPNFLSKRFSGSREIDF